MINVDRCLCYQQMFSVLKKVAEETGSKTIPQLQQHITFGENCKLCHPYVQRMLKSGETVFHELVLLEPEEAERSDTKE